MHLIHFNWYLGLYGNLIIIFSVIRGVGHTVYSRCTSRAGLVHTPLLAISNLRLT